MIYIYLDNNPFRFVLCMQTSGEIYHKNLKWRRYFKLQNKQTFAQCVTVICSVGLIEICAWESTLVAEYRDNKGWGWIPISEEILMMTPLPLGRRRHASIHWFCTLSAISCSWYFCSYLSTMCGRTSLVIWGRNQSFTFKTKFFMQTERGMLKLECRKCLQTHTGVK